MNNLFKTLGLATVLATSFLINSCGKDGGLNIFSIQDDIALGQQTRDQIAADPAQFPILNPATNAAAYAYIYALRDDILASGQVIHKDDFPWEIKIIKDDAVQNAFCTPGGFIYVYTGLIKYLDDKSSLAGVMGHEMAHADKRHSTTQMTKQYGVQTMLDVVLGKDQGLLTQIGTQLISLKFSRTDESQADEYSVKYLCPTKYQADGAANFFQKIIDMGAAKQPEFLSTHPNPDNRVKDIHQHAIDGGCTKTIDNTENVTGYANFKALL